MLNKTIPSEAPAIQLAREGAAPAEFSVRAVLICAAKNAKGTDEWAVAVAVTGPTGQTIDVDYRTGTGLRRYAAPRTGRLGLRPTVYEWETSRPVEPTAKDVLICLGLDVGLTLDMPAEDGAALDYLHDELGMTGKPSATLAALRALRSQLDKVRLLLRGTGITVEDFAARTAEFDQ